VTVCPGCGRENVADARFCNSCGALLVVEETSAQAEPVPSPPPQGPDQQMGEFGRKLGEDLGQMGKAIGAEVERAGREFGNWWDRTFGMLAPVISGLIGVVVFLILILVADAIATVSDHRRFWGDLADFGWTHLWLLIGLIFAGSFSDYFLRRYRRTYRWIRPVVTGLVTVGWFWIFAQVLRIAGSDLRHPQLGDLASFVELMLPVIFALALAIGYLIALLSYMGPEHRWPRGSM